MKTNRSAALFATAKDYFPGGVHSPVRAFNSVDGDPLFMEKGEGPYLYDADGNNYIDFCCSWGPLILGHSFPSVRDALLHKITEGTSYGTPTKYGLDLGKLIVDNHRFIEMIRFVSSGTEAVMSALRLARAYSKRNKIIKFEGCYHGHFDSLLVKAGSGLATFGISTSAGVPEGVVQDTLVANLNDKQSVEKLFREHAGEIAAIIIEPIPANNGLLLQDKSFLKFLREICTANNTLLIFDEVISGFRVGFEGAAGLYNIEPDIITFGKIIGGGLPVGAFAASKEIMTEVAPLGSVYQAGTLSANPLAMLAGFETLLVCNQEGFYKTLEEKTTRFVDGINSKLEEMEVPVRLYHVGSIFWMTGSGKKANSANDLIPAEMEYFKRLHREFIYAGVYFGPSAYEVGFVSYVHSEAILQDASNKMLSCFAAIFGK